MYFIIFLGVKEDVLSAQYYTWSVIYLKTVFIDFNKDCVCKYVDIICHVSILIN